VIQWWWSLSSYQQSILSQQVLHILLRLSQLLA
jgi:hypothetical protein